MGDLISRSALIEEIRSGDKVASFNYFIALVQAQPTAYNVENVVAELENEKERQEKDRRYWSEHSWKDNLVYNEYDLSDKKADLLQEAIDIVKRGGVE